MSIHICQISSNCILKTGVFYYNIHYTSVKLIFFKFLSKELTAPELGHIGKQRETPTLLSTRCVPQIHRQL